MKYLTKKTTLAIERPWRQMSLPDRAELRCRARPVYSTVLLPDTQTHSTAQVTHDSRHAIDLQYILSALARRCET